MNAKELALMHVAEGNAYSWDLTVLLSFGVPLPGNLRHKVLAGTSNLADADLIRSLLKRPAQREPLKTTLH